MLGFPIGSGIALKLEGMTACEESCFCSHYHVNN